MVMTPKYADNKSKIMTLVENTTKEYLSKWAEEEDRSLSKLVDRLLVSAIAERERQLAEKAV